MIFILKVYKKYDCLGNGVSNVYFCFRWDIIEVIIRPIEREVEKLVIFTCSEDHKEVNIFNEPETSLWLGVHWNVETENLLWSVLAERRKSPLSLPLHSFFFVYFFYSLGVSDASSLSVCSDSGSTANTHGGLVEKWELMFTFSR